MKTRIESLAEKKLIGKKIRMSFSNNKTKELWQSFMPLRKEIKNSIGTGLYSIEVYDPFFFKDFDPQKEFEKWAAVEVHDLNEIPDTMEGIIFPAGQYAVFVHKGPASAGPATYEHIFRVWLPDSGFILDHRPHFAVMGEKYKHEDPESEEEIWIPVTPKNI